MSPEAKAALLKRLADGRAKTKAMREDAKAKNLPDPKPRKPRAKKVKAADLMAAARVEGAEESAKQAGNIANKDAQPVDPKMAIADPLAKQPARDTIAPIDAAPTNAVNQVSAMPPSPEENKSSEIDVPNLPSKKKPTVMVRDPEAIPEATPRRDISTTGKPDKYNNNEIIRNLETGDSAISVQYPGQKESIKKMLAADKKHDRPLAPAANPTPKEKTVDSVTKHVPDIKAVEGRQPFSFAAIRKTLYQ
jgi:hypothetical protein